MARADPLGHRLPAPMIVVQVVYAAAPHQLEVVVLSLPAGATAQDALRASGLADRLGAAQPDGLRLGLWGRLCEPNTVLQAQDRLELLRPLLIDPMEARRQRLRRDGLRKGPRRAARPIG